MFQILTSKLQQAEFVHGYYTVLVPHGIGPADMLKPITWAHLASRLKPNDRILVECEDGTWEWNLKVLDVQAMSVLVKPTAEPASFIDADELADPDYTIEWFGADKWCVQRNADKAIIFRGLLNRQQAAAKLGEVIKVRQDQLANVAKQSKAIGAASTSIRKPVTAGESGKPAA